MAKGRMRDKAAKGKKTQAQRRREEYAKFSHAAEIAAQRAASPQVAIDLERAARDIARARNEDMALRYPLEMTSMPDAAIPVAQQALGASEELTAAVGPASGQQVLTSLRYESPELRLARSLIAKLPTAIDPDGAAREASRAMRHRLPDDLMEELERNVRLGHANRVVRLLDMVVTSLNPAPLMRQVDSSVAALGSDRSELYAALNVSDEAGFTASMNDVHARTAAVAAERRREAEENEKQGRIRDLRDIFAGFGSRFSFSATLVPDEAMDKIEAGLAAFGRSPSFLEPPHMDRTDEQVQAELTLKFERAMDRIGAEGLAARGVDMPHMDWGVSYIDRAQSRQAAGFSPVADMKLAEDQPGGVSESVKLILARLSETEKLNRAVRWLLAVDYIATPRTNGWSGLATPAKPYRRALAAVRDQVVALGGVEALEPALATFKITPHEWHILVSKYLWGLPTASSAVVVTATGPRNGVRQEGTPVLGSMQDTPQLPGKTAPSAHATGYSRLRYGEFNADK